MLRGKKISLLVGVLILLIFVFLGIKYKNIFYEFKNRSRQECIDEIKKKSNKELVEHVLRISDMQGGGYASDVLGRYLHCQYTKSNDEKEKEKIFNEVEPLADYFIGKPGEKANFLAKEYFKDPDKAFLRNVATRNFEIFCPNDLPKMCARENDIFLKKSSEWCDNICTTLKSYKDDMNLFDQEVVKFSDTDSAFENDFIFYGWRIALTFGFKGKDEALELCNDLPADFHLLCLRKVSSYDVRKIDCNNIADKMANDLCEIQ